MSGFIDVLLLLFSRGVHAHTVGARPWAWAENNIEDVMANIVGELRKITTKKKKKRRNTVGRNQSVNSEQKFKQLPSIKL